MFRALRAVFKQFIDHTIKYCAVPYGDITAVVRSQDGAAQYLIGISIIIYISVWRTV
jgi:hypothetical protein